MSKKGRGEDEPAVGAPPGNSARAPSTLHGAFALEVVGIRPEVEYQSPSRLNVYLLGDRVLQDSPSLLFSSFMAILMR
jgi:hypothetical protein